MPDDASFNYNHLRYFWVVAREGGITQAAQALGVAPSTISTQISSLEESLDTELFRRSGRQLVLTDAGQAALRFAEDIFLLGRDLTETLRGRATGQSPRLSVGISDVVPKLVATQLLEPALGLEDGIRLVCRTGKPDELLVDLALHRLDLVILDAPPGPGSKIKVHSRLLKRSPILLLGTASLARACSSGFPSCLDDAPFLLPTYESALRPLLDRWFEDNAIRPRLIGEFDDWAQLKAFGQKGLGLVPVAALAATEARRQYKLKNVGRLDPLQASYHGVTVERQLVHPAVEAIFEAAKS